MPTAITENIKISVDAEYQAHSSSPKNNYFTFAYRVIIENKGDYTVQLLRRRWYIFDSNGTINEVEGEGVVGLQPVLEPNQSHQYISGCKLQTDMGYMRGKYLMVRVVDGIEFEVDIPRFELISPAKMN